MNSYGWYLLGFIFICDGIWTLLGGKTLIRGTGYLHPSFEYSILIIITGIIFIVGSNLYYKNKQKIEFSKCPKCKTNYTYSDLKNGICPTCHIKTIEIDEYYKKYPNELDEI